jgi:hypothetical protein
MFRVRTYLPAMLAAAAIGVTVLPTPAHAWWRGGVVIGVAPIVPFYAPPVYVPPPVYYAPPPAYYAPPPAFSAVPPGFNNGGEPTAAGGPSCYAGPYVCPTERAIPVGGACSCPGNNGRVAGSVH